VAILDGAILMTAAASLEGTSSFSDALNKAMNTTPPEFTVTYEERYAHHATNLDLMISRTRYQHKNDYRGVSREIIKPTTYCQNFDQQ
jgi:hypothetical protein